MVRNLLDLIVVFQKTNGIFRSKTNTKSLHLQAF